MSHWRPIPGETPITDISGLRIRSITTRAALNVAEADNIRHAVVKYLAAQPSRRVAPFDVRWLLKLHKEMFGRVWSWAGTLRATELNLGLPSHQLDMALHNLSADLQYWEQESALSMLEQSVILHHRAIAIHPFLNGNGRWARLVANIWLRRHGAPLVRWPEATVGHESVIRKKYLAAIRAADAGDLTRLRELHEKFSADP